MTDLNIRPGTTAELAEHVKREGDPTPVDADKLPAPLPADHPDNDGLVVRGSDGDPRLDPRQVAMTERESYERVVEGLKIAADAAMHRAPHEAELAPLWRGLAHKLDQVRRICVQHAGIGLVIRERPTEVIRGDPMAWRASRDRFVEGMKQAAGGMRQLAACFRADSRWSRMATDIEAVQRKMMMRSSMAAAREAAALILPERYTLQ